ncbi:EmrB/QacA family drug resistance transporter [Novosphingobium resinovorum]|uniref:EmrB/QacA family drug resistance transporter n=1 Tax=Novosphingobium resinovorum TaxID=158500 RepID=A0A031JE41_9SPHN|nr:MFS transporter [Novosphingobium resinovorum]EZP71517.1 EmrB/QacA family drug resistance transporter [Novosphingobium resinovorum]
MTEIAVHRSGAAQPAWIVRVSHAFLTGNVNARPIGAVVAVLLGTFMTSLFTRDFGISLADIRGAYGLSVDEGSWLNTLTNSAQLLSAPAVPLLVVMFGARRVMLISASTFIVSTSLTPLASGVPMIFALHILDGFLLGCFVPATLAIVFSSLSPRYWLIALGLYSVRLSLALHTGVSLSGWFVETIGWQAIYWQATLFGFAFLILSAFSFPDRPPAIALWHRTNKGEVAMFCIGLTLIYAGLDQGNRLDWLASGVVISCIAGGVLLVVCAVAWQYVSPVPFAHPAAILRRNIGIPLIIVTMFGMMSAATSLLIPNFLATVGGLKPIQSGSALWWIDLVQIIAIPAAIWLIRRGDPRLTLVVALVLVMSGCWLGSMVTHDWRANDFAMMSMLLGIGNSMVLLTLIAMSIANAKREELISMVAYIQIPRVVGPEIAVAVLTTFLRKREAFHSVHVGSNLDHVRAASLDMVVGLSRYASIIRREANVLAYAEAWSLCFWVAIVALVLAILLKPTPPHPLAKFAHPQQPN